MKKVFRLLSALLCLSLLMTALPGGGLIEGFVRAEETEAAEIALPDESEPAQAEPEPETVVEEAPAPEEEPQADVPDEGEAETPSEAAEDEPDAVPEVIFSEGYVQIVEDEAALYASASASSKLVAGILKNGVAYAAGRDGDMLFISIYDGQNVLKGWISEKAIRVIDPETELSAYFAACEGGDVFACEEYTLLKTGCRLAATENNEEENNEIEITLEEAAAPEIEAETESEAEPSLLSALLTAEEEEPETLIMKDAGDEPYGIVEKSIKLSVGMKYTLGLDLPEGFKGYEFGTTKDMVVSVDSKGILTANATGNATVSIEKAGCTFTHASCPVTVVAAPTGVSCDVSSVKIGVGDVYDLSPLFHATPKDCPVTMSYYGERESGGITPYYVTVEKLSGIMRGVKAGKERVKAQTQNGKNKIISVTVCAEPSDMKLSAEALDLGVNMNGTLGVTFVPEDAYSVYCFESDDESVVTIDETTGKYRAVGTGDAVLSVRAKNGTLVRTCAVHVSPAPTELSYDAPMKISLGDKTHFVESTVTPGSVCKLAYKSSNTSYLKVDASTGKLTPVKKGSATITVYDANNKELYASCKVTVAAAVTGVTASVDKISLGLGNSYSLTGNGIFGLTPASSVSVLKYTSGNTAILTVDEFTGDMTAIGVGNTSVTATAYNGKSKTIPVSVYALPDSVSLATDTPELGVNMSGRVDIVFPEGTYDLYSYSTASDCIELNDDGSLTATALGTATVSVTTSNGKTASAQIKVLPAPDASQLSFVEGDQTMGAGEKGCFVKAVCAEGTMAEIAYKSSKTAYVKVNASTGALTGVTAGKSATITAYDKNDPDVFITCKVTVVSKPTSVSAKAATLKLGVGNSYDLAANAFFTVKPAGSARSFSYYSETPSVASVDETSGVVSALKKGTTRIQAKTYNGKYKIVTVEVYPLPTKVAIASSTTKLGVNMKGSVSVTFPSGTYDSYILKDESGCLELNADGSFKAVAPGTATVTVETVNGKTDSVDIEVLPAPDVTQLMFIEGAQTMGIGEKDRSVSVEIAEGTMAELAFKSSKTSYVKVNASTGALTGVAKGSSTITVYDKNDPQTYISCVVTVVSKPTSVSAEDSVLYMGVGNSYDLAASGFFTVNPAGSARSFSYYVEDDTYATVDETSGLLNAKKKGTTRIMAKTYNGKYKIVSLQVLPRPTGKITLTPSVSELGEGMCGSLSMSFPSGTCDTELSYSVSPAGIVELFDDGSYTAISAGTATVTASANGGKATGTCTITVLPAPGVGQIYCDPAELTIGAGVTGRSVTASCAPGTMCEFTYESSDTDILRVSKTGVITTVAKPTEGYETANVIVRSANGSSDEVYALCTVKVVPAPASVKLSAERTTIGVGEKVQLEYAVPEGTDTVVSYKVYSGGSYASVNKTTGVVTAKSAGTATLMVTTHNGKTAKLKITVKKAPSAVKFASDSITLGVGEVGILKASYTSGTATTLSYSSDDVSIATIDDVGTITALKTGSTTIHVTTHNGKEATATVNVVPAPTAVTLVAPEVMGVGLKAQLSCTGEPANAHFSTVYEITENKPNTTGETVLLINESGMIAANRPGTAKVRVSTHVDGVYDEKTVTVLKAPSTLNLKNTLLTLDVNDTDIETVYIEPAIDANSYTQYTYTIAKEGYFTIDADGRILPICRGESKVTVKTHNGLTASCTVKIVDRNYPEAIEWETEVEDDYVVVKKGETYTRKIVVSPAGANADIEWSSSDEDVATVSASGKVTAVGYGTTTIKAQSRRNTELVLTYKVAVPLEGRSVTMPVCAAIKSESQLSSAVSTNKSRAEAIKESAFAELQELVGDGKITSSEMSSRKTIINRAFKMLEFPWTTDRQVKYWTSSYDKTKNEINGKAPSKDYYTGTLYYGMPYTQTYRNYNESSIASYYSSSTTNGRRKLITNDTICSRKYKGNDCSSFVEKAVRNASSPLNTSGIASSSKYKYSGVTMKTLYPGDIIVRSGHHVVMFLYYTKTDKSQFVVIEQGGSDDYNTNVVACRVKNASSYTSYKPGRTVF